ncbi:MAG: Spy/CpxP family protein refolding chaperone [Bacteroidota bacterium]|nr:Spy/CpxP family protein refolding chaperone [Bacteroidota bacterium]
MKKILLTLVILFISDFSYSQVQRGNMLQRRGMVDRDQLRERLEQRRESIQNGESDPIRVLNLTEEQRKSFREINSNHLSVTKPLKKEMKKKKLEMQLEKMEDKIDVTTINKLIDEISDLEAEMRKSEFIRNLEIRSLLDDEQQMRLDRMMQRRKEMKKTGMMRRN